MSRVGTGGIRPAIGALRSNRFSSARAASYVHGLLPVELTPYFFADAQSLLASVFKIIATNTLPCDEYLHDHDEELEYARNYEPERRKATGLTKASANRQTELRVAPAVAPRRLSAVSTRLRRARDAAYWTETGGLVLEYLELQAGARFSDALQEGFVGWLEHSPGERRRYEQGDDTGRAAQVDWFLRVVR